MAKSKKGPSDSHNIFDRILKENVQEILKYFLARGRDWDSSTIQELSPNLTLTHERHLDYLCALKNKKGEEFLLHIEFQVKNHPKMLERMQEYHGILYKLYQKPIEHIVIYLGRTEMRMRQQLPPAAQFKGFEVVSLRDLDSSKLLSVQVPEVLILAILTTTEKEPSEELLRSIVVSLQRVAGHPDLLKKYITQLQVIGRLRFNSNILIEKIQAMGIDVDFKPEDDYYYQLATQKWEAKFKEQARKAAEQARQAKEQARQAKEQARQAKEETHKATALALIQKGMDKPTIAEVLGLSLEELEVLLKKKD